MRLHHSSVLGEIFRSGAGFLSIETLLLQDRALR